jgi:hypothetical protein
MEVNITKEQGVSVILIVIIVSVILVLLGFVLIKDEEEITPSNEFSPEEVVWQTYQNRDYGYELTYPSDWNIYESKRGEFPAVNVYKTSALNNDLNLPFDQFENFNHVSIYPEGVPQEAVLERSVDSDVSVTEEFSEKKDYLLENGDVWATRIKFLEPDENWREWGFIWSSLEINEIEYICVSDGLRIRFEECDPTRGDRIFPKGEVDENIIVSYLFHSVFLSG